MNMKDNKNLDSCRAEFAYTQVVNWGSSWRKEAVALVKGLPVSLRAQGLPVTLATLMNGSIIHKRQVAGLIEEWVMNRSPRKSLDQWSSSEKGIGKPGQKLLGACLKADRASYLSAQAEALAILHYVKLFATALWEGGTEMDKEQRDE